MNPLNILSSLFTPRPIGQEIGKQQQAASQMQATPPAPSREANRDIGVSLVGGIK